MKNNIPIKYLEIYYDGECGICRHGMRWLARRQQGDVLQQLAYTSAEAVRRFPHLAEYKPWNQLVVRDDRGQVYIGAESWVMCLAATKRYHIVARFLSLAWVMKGLNCFVRVVSSQRYRLSRFTCVSGSCGIKRDSEEVGK